MSEHYSWAEVMPPPVPVPAITEAEAINLIGPTAWHQLTEAVRKDALALTEAALDAYHLPDLFGAASRGELAAKIHARNPVLYALLRQRAMKAGIK